MEHRWPAHALEAVRGFCRQSGTWIYWHLVKTCQSFWKFCRDRFNRVCLQREEDEPLPSSECIFHKDKIEKFGRVLKNESVSIYRRAQAAYKIGLLAFTGGPTAARFATPHMRKVAYLLLDEPMGPKPKILLLQSVAYWSYLNPASQGKALNLQFLTGLTNIFHDKLEYSSTQEKNKHLLVKFWACYALSILTCNNLPWVKELSNCRFLKYSLQTLASEDWSGWPENFAEVLYFLIGFHRN
ncbi:armadillo-like helical domain-containing protein 2 [Sorex araneus]|uniref:armadillo-like helical domain-containing protein 2 n=1 Tax=Sorex araneus TaxID=42254 RepID=UPI002433CD08|nr:armadillo-like helical domain-containing protein 2 [Sorex araneus]